ncbi:MAG: UvrB/UvrC motif-containing protein [Clostridia bacterium]|nr:UvrB/UvrC motif-containing protein [Clostridia bacterium]
MGFERLNQSGIPGENVCPDCGMTLSAFRTGGILGCPKCYTVFRGALDVFMRKHQEDTHHVGRRPGDSEQKTAWKAERLELTRKMQSAVQQEDYEEAARLRDLIRLMDQEEGADEVAF